MTLKNFRSIDTFSYTDIVSEIGEFRIKMMLGSKVITRIVPCFALPQSYEIFGYRVTNVPLLSSYFGGS